MLDYVGLASRLSSGRKAEVVWLTQLIKPHYVKLMGLGSSANFARFLMETCTGLKLPCTGLASLLSEMKLTLLPVLMKS